MKNIIITIAVLGLAGVIFLWTRMPTESTESPVAEQAKSEIPESTSTSEAAPQQDLPSQANPAKLADLQDHPTAPVSSAQDDEVSLADLVEKLNENPEVARWKREGVTDDDLAQAANRMRRQGFPDDHILDLNLLSPYMPLRNIEPVYFTSITVPETAAAGSPISFSAEANFPDPSFSFDRWEIRQESEVVTIRPLGTRSGESAPAVIVPITLDHEVDPLDPGEYTFRFTGLGEDIEKTVTVY